MSNNIKVLKDFVIVKGEVMYSNLKEASSYKDKDEKRTFNIVIKVKADAVEEVTSAFDDFHTEGHAIETKALKPHKAAAIAKAGPKYKVLEDDKGDPTDDIKITFQRAEVLGAPIVVDKNKEPLDRVFLGRGSEVYVSLRKDSYTFGTTAGAKFTLEQVMVLNEVGKPRRPVLGGDQVDAFFAAVNEDQLAF